MLYQSTCVRTFVAGEPASNFSKRTGIASRPKAGVAFRHPLHNTDNMLEASRKA